MFGRYEITGDPSNRTKQNDLFGQMNDILKVYAPEKENVYEPKGLHPMISVDQAAKELLELIKNEADTSKQKV